MLTEKQKRFCEEYIKCKNGPDAVLKAGYTKRGRWIIAKSLLNNPKIQEYIKHLESHDELNKDYFIRLLKPIAESDEIDMKSKLQAILTLAKISGVMKESSIEDKPIFILKQLGYEKIEE